MLLAQPPDPLQLITLRWVPKDRLPDFRRRVCMGCQRILKRTNEPWTFFDLWKALEAGDAWLFVPPDGSTGFVTVAVIQEYGQRYLHVWAAQHAGNTSDMDTYREDLRVLCRGLGYTKIRFASPRKGWAKWYRLARYVYEDSVEDSV